MRNAPLPYHLYLNVNNSFLGPNMPAGVTPCIWHAAYSRPDQVMMCHVLLETGAHWSGLPIHALSSTDKFNLNYEELMPWASMGSDLEITHLPYLEGLKVSIMLPFKSQGRHTGMVFDWSDGYSRYPQEHKPLSLIHNENGQMALLPNNFMLVSDSHFTSNDKLSTLSLYRRGEIVYWGS